MIRMLFGESWKMSKTACWAFNDETDCANVFFGWPSRWDQCGDVSKHGFQLSKKALKLLLYYDYPFDYNDYGFLDRKRLFDFKIPFEPQIMKKGYYQLSEEEAQRLPTYAKMRLGYLYIKHPQWKQWYEECEPIAGRFMRVTGKYPPSMEFLKQISEEHFNAINRIYQMNDNAIRNSPSKPRPSYMATDEDMKDMLDEWDKEDKIKRQTQAEKWKKWNKQL